MNTKKIVFVDIDTQFDFMDAAGSLYVPGAVDIVANLRKLIEHARKFEIPVIASVDAHPRNDPEFAQFPPHCVIDTPGQRKIDATILEPAYVVAAAAQQTLPSPRAAASMVLEKTVFSIFGNENAAKIFRELEAEKYVVFGVATDYCVKAAVMGLLERGHRVVVVEDAISGVAPESSQAAIAEMKAAGAEFARTADIVS
jgi:nicotinamidase/pyrazinamidase